MKNQVKFLIVLFICVFIASITLFVYQGKYGTISISGNSIRDSFTGELNMPLIALVCQWVLFILALFIAGFYYLKKK